MADVPTGRTGYFRMAEGIKRHHIWTSLTRCIEAPYPATLAESAHEFVGRRQPSARCSRDRRRDWRSSRLPQNPIAPLLGRTTHSITSRYVHSADAVLLAAADAVANATTKLMGEKDADREVLRDRREAEIIEPPLET
jgi:hypothetical protein